MLWMWPRYFGCGQDTLDVVKIFWMWPRYFMCDQDILDVARALWMWPRYSDVAKIFWYGQDTLNVGKTFGCGQDTLEVVKVFWMWPSYSGFGQDILDVGKVIWMWLICSGFIAQSHRQQSFAPPVPTKTSPFVAQILSTTTSGSQPRREIRQRKHNLPYNCTVTVLQFVDAFCTQE